MPVEKIKFKFPEDYVKACSFFGCVENLEYRAGIEFSCGEGLFNSDYVYDALTEQQQKLNERLDQLDGEVDPGVIKVKSLSAAPHIHRGAWTLRFDFDEDALEKGREDRIRNLKLSFS